MTPHEIQHENDSLRADVILLREVLADIRMRLKAGDIDFALMKAGCPIATSDKLPFSGGPYDELMERWHEAHAEKGY